ncbi:MAG: hypothetical protein PHS46_07820, partial [Candidatus Omnitrophica bacterium]|nr:hypothetical protein [Candidatus Omnitrophota bacterium]
SIGYHSSGVALKQIIVTYANESSTEPIGVKVIENSSINSQGNIGTTVITTYTGATIADSGIGAITPTEAIDRQLYTNLTFDARGNALIQELVTEVYEDSAWTFSEAQKLINTYDIHDRLATSSIKSYSAEAMADADFVDRQEVSYDKYDSFGNILNQTIDTYDNTDLLIEHKTVVNKYDPDNVIAQRRGNAKTSTITRWTDSSCSDSKLIDQTVIETKLYDSLGNAVDQTQDISAYNETSGKIELTKENIIHNSNFTSRGDAESQTITSYGTDSTGELASTPLSYEEISDITYDARHNATSKTVCTYTDATKTTPVSIQEIENTRIDFKGNVTNYTSDTYIYDSATGNFVFDTKTEVETSYNSRGIVTSTTAITYISASQFNYDASVSGLIDETSLTASTKTVEVSTAWDVRGNATAKTSNSYAWDPSQGSSGQFVWTQEVSGTYAYEYHGFVAYSDEVTYVATDMGSTIYLTRPSAPNLTQTTHTIVDMTAASIASKYCESGKIQSFDAWGNAKYQITEDYNYVSGAWRQVDTAYKENTSFDARGRLTGYSERVNGYVDGTITTTTTNTVTLGVYDNKNRYTTIDSTSTEKDTATSGSVLTVTYTSKKTGITYNALNQMTAWTETSTSSDSPDKITISATSGVTYDIYGRMKYRFESVTEKSKTGTALSHTYTVDTTISNYNILGQVLKMAAVTVDGGKTTTQTDSTDRKYNASGLLSYSDVSINEKGTNLDHTYEVKTSIDNYNALGQAVWMNITTIDGNKTTLEYTMANNEYDSNGNMQYSNHGFHETGTDGTNTLDHWYGIETWTGKDGIGSYNSLGQILTQTTITTDGDLRTVEEDKANRTYNTLGQLTSSAVEIRENVEAWREAYLGCTQINSTQFTMTDAYLYNGVRIRIKGTTLSGGISSEVDYFVVGCTTTPIAGTNSYLYTFSLALTKDGAAITTTSTGSGMNIQVLHIYTTATSGITYDTLGQVKRITTTTVDNSKTTVATDIADRTYDSLGRLINQKIEYHETGSNLNSTYTVETKMSGISGVTNYYNTFGQVIRMQTITTTTIDANNYTVTTETDSADRVYWYHGRLSQSNVSIHEVGVVAGVTTLNHTYSVQTNITSYSSRGIALRMTTITVDGGITTKAEDYTDRAYDALGRMISNGVTYTETGAGLNHTYTLDSWMSYNGLGQVVYLTQKTHDGDKWTVEENVTGIPRVYDSLGRLTYSKTTITETGGNLNHAYTVETTISSYNAIGQALKMTQVTVDGGKTTVETDSANRTYDASGRLSSSTIHYHETGTSDGSTLDNSYNVRTWIGFKSGDTVYGGYNSLGQIDTMLTYTEQTDASGKFIDGSKVTYEWDATGSHRLYDTQGRLSYSKVTTHELDVTGTTWGTVLDHYYTVETFIGGYINGVAQFGSYNSLGQVKMTWQKTTDGAKVTDEYDATSRLYDTQGRLSYSKVQDHETGTDGTNTLDHWYGIETWTGKDGIGSYNSLGQILTQTTITTDGDLRTVEEDKSNRTYNTLGQLTSSAVEIRENVEAWREAYLGCTQINSTQFTMTDAYLYNGVRIRIKGTTLSGGISSEVDYFVVGCTTTPIAGTNSYLYTFSLALTKDGAAITTTSTGSGMNIQVLHIYTTATSGITYDTLGQVKRITTTTVDNSKTTVATDIADRTYDSLGRLINQKIEYHETGSNLNSTYTVETKMSGISGVTNYYNTFGQVIRMQTITTTTIDANNYTVTTETDSADRVYWYHGRLSQSNVSIHEVGVVAGVTTLNHTYSVQTNITSYSSRGIALRMTTITVDGGITTKAEDYTDRAYDALGRMISNGVTYTETGAGLNHTYTLDSWMSYNGLGQVVYLTQKTHDGDKWTVEENVTGIPRVYDSLGRLTYSKTTITETGGNLNHAYTVETTISSYNAIGQALKMTQVTVDGGKTTVETDSANRTYDASGRLLTSSASITEKDSTGTVLNHTYTVATTINNYNTLGQVAVMTRTTVDGDKMTIETDINERKYNSLGQLYTTGISVTELGTADEGGVLSHTYIVTSSITDYNALGQIKRMNTFTFDQNNFTTESDMADRTYDAYGRLSYSKVSVTEQWINADNTVDTTKLWHYYTVETWIGAYKDSVVRGSYNDLGQVNKMLQITTDGGKITEELDLTPRRYDQYGRLSYTCISVYVHGTGLNYTNIETTWIGKDGIGSYNSLGQVLRMKYEVNAVGVTTTTIDSANRTYDLKGRLLTSSTSITEKDSTGTVLNHIYTVSTNIGSYNTLNQVLQMEQITIEQYYNGTEVVNTKKTTQTDAGARTYDTHGRLLTSNITIKEEGLEGAYTHIYNIITNITDYDAADQVLKMSQYTYNLGGAQCIAQVDIENRRYNSSGLLKYSYVTITETDTNTGGGVLNHSYTTETTVNSYNALGQMLKQTVVTVDYGVTTTQVDSAVRIYDSRGRLTYSKINVTEEGVDADDSYSLETTMSTYLNFDQVSMMTKVTVNGDLTKTETDWKARSYNSYGMLTTAYVKVNELGDNLNYTYFETTIINSYNALGQINSLSVYKIDTSDGTINNVIKTTLEQDILSPRVYYIDGRLKESCVKITEKGTGLNHSYTVKTTISSYDYNNMVGKMTQVTVDNGVTTTVSDIADRSYDAGFLLRGTYVQVTDSTGRSYTVFTSIFMYNDIGQAISVRKTTVEGNLHTEEEDCLDSAGNPVKQYDAYGRIIYSKVKVHTWGTDANGNAYSETYNLTNDITKYNSLGQVLRMTQTIVPEEGTTKILTDSADRQYNTLGQLTYSSVTTEEKGFGYYLTYKVTTWIDKYNTQGYVARLRRITEKGGLTTSETSIADELYDVHGNNIYSMREITESGDGFYLQDIKESKITYNELNQVLRQTIVTKNTDGSTVTATDIADNRYDSLGRLIFSKTAITKTNTGLETYQTVETEISAYNSIGQALSETITTVSNGVTSTTNKTNIKYDLQGRENKYSYLTREVAKGSDGSAIDTSISGVESVIKFNDIGQAVSTRSVTVKNGVTSTTDKTNIKYNSIGIETGYNYTVREVGKGADGSAIDTSISGVESVIKFNDIGQAVSTRSVTVKNGVTSTTEKTNIKYNSIGIETGYSYSSSDI